MQNLEALNKTAAAIAALATFVAALIALAGARPKNLIASAFEALFLRGRREFMSTANAARRPGEGPLDPAIDRLEEARTAFARQTSAVRANRWISGLITFVQYIVGGVLASSFVQQSLDKGFIGALGLLVLFSSLVHQHFRPDIRLRGALGRANRLRALIRQAEDDLYAMQSNVSGAPSVNDFRRNISSTLSEIESSELQDLVIRKDGQQQTGNVDSPRFEIKKRQGGSR